MKKIYNLIIAVLIVALIVVIAMIILRYGGNHLNEKEVSASIVEIEEKLNEETTNKPESLPELKFKGYKIYSCIAKDNIPSLKLHEKYGFKEAYQFTNDKEQLMLLKNN